MAGTALTTHVWLLAPAIHTNHYLIGCKPGELEVCLPSALYTTDFSNASPPAVWRDTPMAQGCSRDLAGVTARCAAHSPALSQSGHSKLVGMEPSSQLQRTSHGGKRLQGWAADTGIQARFTWRGVISMLRAAGPKVASPSPSSVSPFCGGHSCPVLLQSSCIVGSRWWCSRITEPLSSSTKVKSST